MPVPGQSHCPSDGGAGDPQARTCWRIFETTRLREVHVPGPGPKFTTALDTRACGSQDPDHPYVCTGSSVAIAESWITSAHREMTGR